MKLGVIALDYDGTTALHDRLEPAVREAIADARTRGITVLIVTGRSLDELRRVAGDLHFVDVVVAENGAVLHFPGNDYTTLLAAAVPAVLVEPATPALLPALGRVEGWPALGLGAPSGCSPEHPTKPASSSE